MARKVWQTREGVLTLGTEKGGRIVTTPREIVQYIASENLKVLVPIDKRVSPWPMPKLFELSFTQSVHLLSEMGKADDGFSDRISWQLRPDGRIALVPSEITRADNDGSHRLFIGGPPPLPED